MGSIYDYTEEGECGHLRAGNFLRLDNEMFAIHGLLIPACFSTLSHNDV